MGNHRGYSRRRLLKATASVPFAASLAPLAAFANRLEPTPEIPDADEPTPSQTEGPYYKRNSPERKNLAVAGVAGTALVVSGKVVDTSGKPIAKALVDVWHCDPKGDYDNSGFKFRGHVFADEDGHYQFETIEPGLYPGRTRHIHVRVQAPNGKPLTTQLYFPSEPGNARDGIYDKRLLMEMGKDGDKKTGKFDFVLRA
ncbi:MAG: intradiol ring-cleavage dioxygenase [Fimbriimonadaceae bacterium]